MNPYLRIPTRIPATTYFYAWEILETRWWPETEPTSKNRPKSSFVVVEELPIGADSRRAAAMLKLEIFADSDSLGIVKLWKELVIKIDGVFSYSPPGAAFDTHSRKTSEEIYRNPVIRWDDSLTAKIEDFYHAWEPSSTIDYIPFLILNDLIIQSGIKHTVSIDHTTTPATQINISYALWPYSKSPMIYYTVWQEELTAPLGKAPQIFHQPLDNPTEALKVVQVIDQTGQIPNLVPVGDLESNATDARDKSMWVEDYERLKQGTEKLLAAYEIERDEE